jgi:hypothetical protein
MLNLEDFCDRQNKSQSYNYIGLTGYRGFAQLCGNSAGVGGKSFDQSYSMLGSLGAPGGSRIEFGE